jgi:hypothetical protein
VNLERLKGVGERTLLTHKVSKSACGKAFSPAQQVPDSEQFGPDLFQREGFAVDSGKLGFMVVLLEIPLGPGNRIFLLVKQIFDL